MMDMALIVDVNVFSALVLVVLWLSSLRQTSKQNTQYRLYFLLLLTTFAMLVLDSVAWLVDNRAGAGCILANWIFNGLLYISTPLVSALWVLYADYQIFTSGDRLEITAKFLLLPLLLINAVLTLASPFYSTYYHIDASGSYCRDSLFVVFVVIALLPACYAELLTLLNRARLNSHEYVSMLIFPLAPIIGGAMQAFFYGLPLIWSGVTLALIAVYVNIQDRLAQTDYLTGVFNRRQADDYLRQKIRATEQGRGFSGILIDIDDFKQINDRYGHAEGDVCLATVVQQLRTTLRRDDFLARVGGDEFLVILDIASREELNRARQRITESVRTYNLNSGKMYQISLSMGADLYSARHGHTRTAFFKHLDRLMYADKSARKMERARYEESRRRYEDGKGQN